MKMSSLLREHLSPVLLPVVSLAVPIARLRTSILRSIGRRLDAELALERALLVAHDAPYRSTASSGAGCLATPPPAGLASPPLDGSATAISIFSAIAAARA